MKDVAYNPYSIQLPRFKRILRGEPNVQYNPDDIQDDIAPPGFKGRNIKHTGNKGSPRKGFCR
jgi:hypothetical protein